MSAVVETNVGDLPVTLFCSHAPKTCLNFIKLAKIRYYEYCLFHRIEKDFIAQTGDPTGSGKGGDSIFGLVTGRKERRFFEDEVREGGPRHSFNRMGLLGMANSGKDRNGSQFFLTLAADLDYLDGKYTLFGHASLEDPEALAVLQRINSTLCDEKGAPLQKVWIKQVRILEDPFPDPPGLVVPRTVPVPEAFRDAAQVDAAEPIVRESEVPVEELEAKRRREEAASQALTLEMLGDLPSADVLPPENVLFVCKLNPLTEGEDLATIFARFGSIRSCQVIKDKETGNSLGYAFVEFEAKESCEAAYLKMDNVLIDDRRIHVDFSQSVSRLHGAWAKERKRLLATSRQGGLAQVRDHSTGTGYAMAFAEQGRDRYDRHRADGGRPYHAGRYRERTPERYREGYRR